MGACTRINFIHITVWKKVGGEGFIIAYSSSFMLQLLYCTAYCTALHLSGKKKRQP